MAFIAGPRVVSATGGISTTIVGGYIIHTFLSGIGTFTPTTSGVIEVLVCGGGGGQGSYGNGYGGGGGGGAVAYSKFVPVTAGVGYTIMGGTSGVSGPFQGVTQGSSGGMTTFFAGGPSNPGYAITAAGGGGGGYSAFGSFNGGVGSSSPNASGGGGGAGRYPGLFAASGGLGASVTGLGYPGGAGYPGGSPSPSGSWHGGGGGGAGGGGSSGTNTFPTSTTGGQGVPYGITGVNNAYGAGGAAGGTTPLPPGAVLNSPLGLGDGGPGGVIIRYPG